MPYKAHEEFVDAKNIFAYHIIVALIACILTALFWIGDLTLNQSTAAAAFVLLFLVMVIGPIMRLWWEPFLRNLPYGIPYRWRGELGIWFVIFSVLHTVLTWHEREAILPFRHGDFIGLVALLWGTLLAATSSARGLKFLGVNQWKWLQTTGAYAIFYMVVGHTIYHAWLRPTFAPTWIGYLYVSMIFIVLVLQLGAFSYTVSNAKNLGLENTVRRATLIVAVAGVVCLGVWALLAPEPKEKVVRAHEWIPEKLTMELYVQTAFNEDEIFFRFKWNQPDAGGWHHDLLVFQDGEWRRFVDPDPWMVEGESGFYEDRLSFKIDDGSVKGFANFAGWLTQHAGVRHMPGEPSREEIEAHPWLGQQLGHVDVRKYIPQSRKGEWWEGPWDEVISPDELKQLKADGVFLDLPMWRAHRSNAVEYGTDHWILDYRYSDEGSGTYSGQRWDPVEGPTYMFDPAVVEGGALDIAKIYEDPEYYRQDLFYEDRETWLGEEEPYFLHEDFAVPFDPDRAQWEGAAIPHQILRAPEGSTGAWRARGIWRDQQWIVEMSRDLDTGYDDDKQFEAGNVYTWSPAVHHGSGSRWHWVAYPYMLGLGLTADQADIEPVRYVEAIRIEGDRPNWDDIPTKTIPLIYPGLIDWTWLTSEQHLGYQHVREDAMSMWDWHNDAPEELADLFLMLR